MKLRVKRRAPAMKNRDLIAEYLRRQAGGLQRQLILDAAISFGIAATTLTVQFGFFWLCWHWFGFQMGLSYLTILVLAFATILLQFPAYAMYGNWFSDTAHSGEVDGRGRLIFGAFFFIGPQRLTEAIRALAGLRRMPSIDFNNCARIVEAAMKVADWLPWPDIEDAAFPRPAAAGAVQDLGLFRGWAWWRSNPCCSSRSNQPRG